MADGLGALPEGGELSADDMRTATLRRVSVRSRGSGSTSPASPGPGDMQRRGSVSSKGSADLSAMRRRSLHRYSLTKQPGGGKRGSLRRGLVAVRDLVLLERIDHDAVVQVLKKRFTDDQIYVSHKE